MDRKQHLSLINGSLSFGVRVESNLAPSATVPGQEFSIPAYMGLTDIERAQIMANMPKAKYNGVTVDNMSVIDRQGTDKFDVAAELRRSEKDISTKLSDLVAKDKQQKQQNQQKNEEQKGS